MKPNDLHALHDVLHKLKLDQMALSLDALCQQAAKESWTYSVFLARLLDEELSGRQQRRLAVTTKMAHFPFHKTLEQFDFAFQPSVEKRRLQELASLRFVAGGETSCYWGRPGSVKRTFPLPLASKPWRRASARTSSVCLNSLNGSPRIPNGVSWPSACNSCINPRCSFWMKWAICLWSVRSQPFCFN